MSRGRGSLFDEQAVLDERRRMDAHLASIDRRMLQALEDLGLKATTTWDPDTGRFSLSLWEYPVEGLSMTPDAFVARLEDLAREVA